MKHTYAFFFLTFISFPAFCMETTETKSQNDCKKDFPFHEAAQKGDINFFLQSHSTPTLTLSQQDEKGDTPLHKAAEFIPKTVCEDRDLFENEKLQLNKAICADLMIRDSTEWVLSRILKKGIPALRGKNKNNLTPVQVAEQCQNFPILAVFVTFGSQLKLELAPKIIDAAVESMRLLHAQNLKLKIKLEKYKKNKQK